jgi:hypothetical protein
MGKQNGKLGMIMHCQIEKNKNKSSRNISSINDPPNFSVPHALGEPKMRLDDSLVTHTCSFSLINKL